MVDKAFVERACLRNRVWFLEDLGRVPMKESRFGLGEARQRRGAEPPEVVAAKGVVHSCAMDGTGDYHLEPRQNSEGTGVEELVVESAEGHAVGDDGGTVGLVPADVGRFESDRRVLQAPGEGTDSAAVGVGGEYAAAECRVAPTPTNEINVSINGRAARDLGWNRCGIENSVLKSRREMLYHEGLGDPGREARVVLQRAIDSSCEACLNRVLL